MAPWPTPKSTGTFAGLRWYWPPGRRRITSVPSVFGAAALLKICQGCTSSARALRCGFPPSLSLQTSAKVLATYFRVPPQTPIRSPQSISLTTTKHSFKCHSQCHIYPHVAPPQLAFISQIPGLQATSKCLAKLFSCLPDVRFSPGPASDFEAMGGATHYHFFAGVHRPVTGPACASPSHKAVPSRDL